MNINEKQKFDEFIKVAHKVSQKFPYEDREDLVQEAFFIYENCKNKYDKNGGNWVSFIWIPIYHQMSKYMGENRKTLSLDNLISTSVDDDEITFADLVGDGTNFEEDFINKDYIDKHLKSLNETELEILEMWCEQDVTKKELLDKYNMTYPELAKIIKPTTTPKTGEGRSYKRKFPKGATLKEKYLQDYPTEIQLMKEGKHFNEITHITRTSKRTLFNIKKVLAL